MRYSLAVFDLDGTLLDTLDDLTDSLNAALAAFSLPPRSRDEVRSFVGNGIRKLVERGVPPLSAPDTVSSVFDEFCAYYALHCADRTKLYDGIIPLLQALRQRGRKIAVVSNKADFAVQQLCDRYLNGLNDYAVGERDGVRRKPAPDSVNAALEALHIDREHAVYIGDSEVDIQTAKNAGIPCLSVDWGFRDREALTKNGASVIISQPDALLAYF